jgi:hypothetical protein
MWPTTALGDEEQINGAATALNTLAFRPAKVLLDKSTHYAGFAAQQYDQPQSHDN